MRASHETGTDAPPAPPCITPPTVRRRAALLASLALLASSCGGGGGGGPSGTPVPPPPPVVVPGTFPATASMTFPENHAGNAVSRHQQFSFPFYSPDGNLPYNLRLVGPDAATFVP